MKILAIATLAFIVAIGAWASECFAQTPTTAIDALATSPDQPLADVISGEFYIHTTSERLTCQAGFSWLADLAEAGDAEAMFELGGLYEVGSCAPVDKPKALAWLIKASEKGNGAASSAVGRLYYSGGQGITANYAEALRWSSKGAILFNAEAFYYLGLLYQNGMGVPADHQKAYALFNISMHLYAFFTDGRTVAPRARDNAREALTPSEVADAKKVSEHLLNALLEHDDQKTNDLFPQEALAVLHDKGRQSSQVAE